MTELQKHLAPGRLEGALADKKPRYSQAEAIAEAERCLYCADAPCIKACPTTIDIPTFIKKIASGNVRGSARTILEQNLLGASCARVCPVEVLCAGDCVYNAWGREPIAIGRLQRFATETALEQGEAPLFVAKAKTGRRVALVGAGPASLACAGTLALEGHSPVIFEKRAVPGGLNTTGIAPYKLHADASLLEVEWVLGLGVRLELGRELGKDLTADELLASYDAVFLGVGLGADTRLAIPGEDGPGVVGATWWIERMKLDAAAESPKGKRVVVVGGGNTALDVARECALLGASEVVMAYRRSEADMSGYRHELEGARKEGVRLVEHAAPVEVVRGASGQVTALRVAALGDGKAIAGSERDLACDLVVVAIGQSKLRDLVRSIASVEVDARGCVVVDGETKRTGNPKVYAGGDAINGGKEVVNAVADGRDAARAMSLAFSRGGA